MFSLGPRHAHLCSYAFSTCFSCLTAKILSNGKQNCTCISWLIAKFLSQICSCNSFILPTTRDGVTCAKICSLGTCSPEREIIHHNIVDILHLAQDKDQTSILLQERRMLYHSIQSPMTATTVIKMKKIKENHKSQVHLIKFCRPNKFLIEILSDEKRSQYNKLLYTHIEYNSNITANFGDDESLWHEYTKEY